MDSCSHVFASYVLGVILTIFEFIGVLTGHLAWPVTALIIFILIRLPLKTALSHVAKLKYGDTEVTFSEVSKKIITQNPSEEEKENLVRHQIIFENTYSRLYSNGVLVHRFKITVKAGETGRQIIYPLTFPNEPLKVEFIGSINAHVKELNQGNFTFECEAVSKDREIELVISGV